MRKFSEADKKKKTGRIIVKENPEDLSKEMLSQLENTVKVSLKDGYISCVTAWKIAKDANVTKAAVGDIIDRLDIRITDCRIGCFKIDKTPYDGSENKDEIDRGIAVMLRGLKENNQLTCGKVFDIAKRYKLKPMTIANEANVNGLKVLGCQLGCF